VCVCVSVCLSHFGIVSKQTRSSANAEGPREALVSRNPATTKHLT